MKEIGLLTIIFLLLFCAVPVNSTTISFANPTDIGERDLLMYAANGSYIATYNLTTVGIELPTDTDVYFIAKAHTANPMNDPSNWLGEVFGYLQTNVTALVIIFGLIGMIWLGRR